jgi:DNA-binding CsgD family transcriptional regulator
MEDVEETLISGRGAELAFLRHLVEDLQAGVGAAVLVEGEQGVGKSALLRAGFAGAAEAGIPVWWGAADEVDQPFPLRLAIGCVSAEAQTPEQVEAVLRTGEAILAGDPVLAKIERMLSVVDQMCAISPVLLVAENLQWADEASITTWRRLSRAVSQLPLLLAGSVRPGTGRPDLDRLRRGLIAHRRTVLTLQPLSPDLIADLVRDVLGGTPGPRLADALRQAGGNPLYARELAEALVREGRVRVAGQMAELSDGPVHFQVPTSLAAVLKERLSGLPPDVVAVLRQAALLGLEFAVPDLEVLTGLTAGELMGVVEAGTAAGVLTDAGLHLSFRHALIRQLLHDEMSADEHAVAHLEAARSLALAGASPEQVAAQLLLVLGREDADADAISADSAQAWIPGWLANTAVQFTYRAPQVAAGLLRAVLRRLPDTDPHREQLEVSLIGVAFLLMHGDEVEEVGCRLLERNCAPETMAETAWLVAFTRLRAGRVTEAAAVVDGALRKAGVSELRTARLHALQGLILVESGDFDEAARVASAALAAAERTGDRLGAGYALQALSRVDSPGPDRRRRLSYIDRALLVTADDPQTTDLRVTLLGDRTSELAQIGRQAEAIDAAQRALGLAEQAGTPWLPIIRTLLGQLYYEAGRWDDALAELGLANAATTDSAAHLVDAVLALIAAHRDDWDEAGKRLAEITDESSGPLPFWAGSHYSLLARALGAEQAEQPAEAVSILRQCLGPGFATRLPGRYQLLPPLVRLALATGDAETAAAAAAAASSEAAVDPVPLHIAAAAHCQGLLAGDPAPVLTAARSFEEAGRPLERAQALEDAAVLAAARDDSPAARQALTAATAAYNSLGAQWDIRRSAARLRSYGVRRGRASYKQRPATGWDALTPTELKIAYLVAAGQSNPDIAAALFLSRNTVQTHVSHILAKLGARSRAEILSEAARHPQADPASG